MSRSTNPFMIFSLIWKYNIIFVRYFFLLQWSICPLEIQNHLNLLKITEWRRTFHEIFCSHIIKYIMSIVFKAYALSVLMIPAKAVSQRYWKRFIPWNMVSIGWLLSSFASFSLFSDGVEKQISTPYVIVTSKTNYSTIFSMHKIKIWNWSLFSMNFIFQLILCVCVGKINMNSYILLGTAFLLKWFIW